MASLTGVIDNGPWWEDRGGCLPRNNGRVGQLILQRHAVATRSGLGEANMAAFWEPRHLALEDWEREHVRALIKNRLLPSHPAVPNLRYRGKQSLVREKMVTFTGTMVRNFVDARILSVDEIVDMQFENGFVDAAVLLIPDLVIAGETEARNERQKQAVISVLRRRFMFNEPVVVFAQDTKTPPYGKAMDDELKAFLESDL